MNQPYNPSKKAFTLIELLVVVAIITILVAVLIPSLAHARRLAKTAKCGANLRGIATSILTYASEWDDAIPGSPATTSGVIYTDPVEGSINSAFGNINPPPVVQVNDWITPISPALNITYTYTGAFNSNNYRRQMFEIQRKLAILTCPSNQFMAGTFGTAPSSLAGPMPSYSMGVLFLYASGFKENGTLNGDYVPLKNSYRPKVSRVGNTSQKIMVADGARYCSTQHTPTVNVQLTTANSGDHGSGMYGGTYADWGPWSKFSKAWDRGLVPGNDNYNHGSFEARLYSFRHGGGTEKGPAGSFKANAAFFDGHVELMDDLKFSNPALWCPSGEAIGYKASPQEEMQTDVYNTYAKGQTLFMAP